MSIHLHVRSSYTLLNSTISINKLVRKSKELGFTHVALCDKNIMHGAMEFKNECIKYDITPIYGLEFDVNINDSLYPFILLAKNNHGFLDLIKLSTYLSSENNYIELDQLSSYKNNCF